MTGMTNKIENSNDLDGVIRELTDGFSEELSPQPRGCMNELFLLSGRDGGSDPGQADR